MIETFETLESLLAHDTSVAHYKDGMCVYVEDKQAVYSKQNGEWIEGYPASMTTTDADGKSGITVSLYDLNASVMESMPVLSEQDMQKYIDEVNKLVSKDPNHDMPDDDYMLLNHSQNYVSVFRRRDYSKDLEFDSFGKALLTVLSELGEIHCFDILEGHFEIWVKTVETNTMTCFLCFPCKDLYIDYGWGN